MARSVEYLSNPTWEWIEALRQEAGVRFSVFRSRKSLDLLDRIETAAEPLSAIELVALLPYLSRAVRVQTVAVVENLVAPLTADGVLRFVESARLAWRREDPSAGAEHWVARVSASTRGVQVVCTCHPSGYVREAALQALAAESTGVAMGFALVRLNDWVPQVRAAAVELILRTIEEGRGEEWVRWLPIVCRLARATRADHADVVRRIGAAVSRCPELLDAFESNDREVRRYACSIALPRADTMLRGLRSRDPIIRLRYAAAAIENDRNMADSLARDPYPPIRKLAIQACPERAREFLFDGARSIRTLARARVCEEAAPIYREVFEKNEKHRLTALRGLAECGDPSDQSRFVVALSDARPAIRAAALDGLARVSQDPPIAAAWTAMRDASPRVRRAAIRLLLKNRLVLDAARVRDILDGARDPSAIRHALALASSLPKWAAGTLLLEATRSVVTEHAQSRFACWLNHFNRSFETPTPAQIAAFRAAAARAALDPTQRSALDHILRTL